MQLNLFGQPNTADIETNKFNLFEFQEKAIRKIIDLIDCGSGKDGVILIAATGAGKTVMCAEVLHRLFLRRSMKFLFLVDLKTLIEQTPKTLDRYKLPYQIVKRKTDNLIEGVNIMTIQSVKNRPPEFFAGIAGLVADECHELCFTKSWDRLCEIRPTSFKLGLTATPWRLNPREYLGMKFSHKVEAPQPYQLIKLNRIVPARVFSYDCDRDALRVRGNEFVLEDVVRDFNTLRLETIVDNWINENPKQLSTVAYCPNNDISEELCGLFNDVGIPAVFQTGLCGKKKRKAIAKGLENNDIKVCCSVDTQTKGWDYPDLRFVILAFYSQSKARVVQAIGRAGRIAKGKTHYTVLDFGRNIESLGIDPNGVHDYNIFDYYKGAKMIKDRTQIDRKVKEVERVDDVQLVEYYSEQTRTQRDFIRSELNRCFFERKSPRIAFEMFLEKFGFVPLEGWGYGAIWENPDEITKTLYKTYLERLLPNEISVIHYYYYMFGEHFKKKKSRKKRG